MDLQNRRLTVDVIQWLSGDDAAEAYQADNPGETEGPPNDYYILNDNPRLRTLPVAEAVTVELVRLHLDGDADLDPSTWDGLLQYLMDYEAFLLELGSQRPSDGRLSYQAFWVTIEHQVVVHIEEQYTP